MSKSKRASGHRATGTGRVATATTWAIGALLATAAAADPAGDGMWMSLGGLAGTTRPDGKLSDYQWDTGPKLAWGAEALPGNDLAFPSTFDALADYLRRVHAMEPPADATDPAPP